MAQYGAQHNIEDLTNRRYGRLVVIERAKNRRSGKAQKASAYWLCQCDCESDPKEIQGASLKAGLTESCGCLHLETIATNGKAKLIDLKGKRFGKLEVLKQAKNRGHLIFWLVQCDCGSNPYEVDSYKLRNDRYQCPECSRVAAVKDLTGKRFGMWTVIERSEKSNDSTRTFWLAQCSCGSEPKILRSDYFANKGSASDCGCVYLEGKQKIVGQKFGRFTVKKWLHHTQYLCECSCGSGLKEVDGCLLIAGHTKSCGCYNRESASERTSVDIKGQKFGKWTALYRICSKCSSLYDGTGGGGPLWFCECDCGEGTGLYTAGYLRRKENSTGCGCKIQKGKGHHNFNGGTPAKRKIRKAWSGAIRKALKRNHIDKAGRPSDMLAGYSIDAIEKRLKSTLPTGYDWERDFVKGKGVLHIDHIIPVSLFNFKTIDDPGFKQCFALKNLQLLPAIENIQKGAKLEKHFQPSLIFGEKEA